MKQSVTQTAPTAHVSVGKNRQPKGSQVYLKNGQEFEIELFNPLTTTVLAKISLNGVPIGGGGIILRPGEHVFIERFLDKQNKFKFETYEVASNNLIVDQAIKNNGLVKIEFYNEIIGYPIILGVTNNWYQDGSFGKPNNYWYDNFNTTSYSTSGIIGNNGPDGASGTEGIISANNLTHNTKETGRIEEGSHSQQQFEISNKSFNYYAFSTITYQIVPLSTKPVTASEIKVYCVECGAKRKKDSHKFCSTCGNKFE